MKELKLHAEGANQHLKSIKERFETLKKKLNSNTELSDKEKEIMLEEARKIFLNEKKELKNKLF